jgi:hypothetical protein
MTWKPGTPRSDERRRYWEDKAEEDLHRANRDASGRAMKKRIRDINHAPDHPNRPQWERERDQHDADRQHHETLRQRARKRQAEVEERVSQRDLDAFRDRWAETEKRPD